MSSALVLGGHGSGLSTFFGLLYTAEVRLGSEEADEFRFHVDRESIRRLEAIYGELGDGRFPESEVDWGRTPLTFLFGFRRNGFRRSLARSAAAEEEFPPYRIEIGGLPTEEIAELAGRDAVLDGTTRRLLRSPIVLPIVDASVLPDVPSRPEPRLFAEDRRLAQSLELLLRFLSSERNRRARRLFPLFVLTKCDQLSAMAARRLGAPAGPPSSWAPEARTAFGGRILAEHLPETERILRGSPESRVEIARPVWYFSEVGTEVRGTTRIRRRWRTPVGGWEPDYPFEEYHALLDRLGDLAHRLPERADA